MMTDAVRYSPCRINGDTKEAETITRAYLLIVRGITKQLVSGNYDATTWNERIQNAIRQLWLHQAAAGTPDHDARQLSPEDRRRVEEAIGRQYDYLAKFHDAVVAAQASGGSLDFVENRAASYVYSGESAYWEQAAGHLRLPAYPRDGTSECGPFCKCQWGVDCSEPGVIKATWYLGDADHCETCVKRSEEWRPLLVSYPTNAGNKS